MAGILTVARYKTLVPTTELSDSVLASYLSAAQAIAEQLSGLAFGAEITAVESLGGDQYKLTVGTPVGELGDSVRLLGGGVSSTPFEIVDLAQGSITVESATAITSSTTKALPVIEFVGSPRSGHVYCPKRPVFSVVSVETRDTDDALWSDSSVVTALTTSQYETFRGSNNLKAGVFVVASALPRSYEGGQFLVKRLARLQFNSIRVTYAAGFYVVVPADLELAAVQVVGAIEKSIEDGGVFASENIDYYSYQNLTYDQMAAVPHAAVATFKRYANY